LTNEFLGYAPTPILAKIVRIGVGEKQKKDLDFLAGSFFARIKKLW
jgi:hypothetical protein